MSAPARIQFPRLHRVALLAVCGLIFGACSSSKLTVPPLGFHTTITIRDDTRSQLHTITDAATVQRIHTLISTLTAQKGRTVVATPAASRQIIVIETSGAAPLRLDVWPQALSDGKTTWPMNEASALVLFELLGLENPVRH